MLPLEFEDDWAGEEETPPADGPRVVFEPPRFVTLPPEVMPPAGAGDSAGAEVAFFDEAAFPEIPSEPPLGPLLPSIATETLPEVAPLVAQNEFEKVPLPEFTPPQDPLAPPAAAEPGPGAAPGLKLKAPVSAEAYHEVVRHLQEGILPKAEAPAKPSTAGDPAAGGNAAALPYGIPVPGRPGLVRSPRGTEMQLVDVTGMAVGDKVKCPFTGDFFRVPPALEASNKAVEPDKSAEGQAP